MNIGNDDNLHKAPSLWRTSVGETGGCKSRFLRGCLPRTRLAGETSSGVIICPSSSIIEGAEVKANPFAQLIMSVNA
jgi:hypothetical protein